MDDSVATKPESEKLPEPPVAESAPPIVEQEKDELEHRKGHGYDL